MKSSAKRIFGGSRRNRHGRPIQVIKIDIKEPTPSLETHLLSIFEPSLHLKKLISHYTLIQSIIGVNFISIQLTLKVTLAAQDGWVVAVAALKDAL